MIICLYFKEAKEEIVLDELEDEVFVKDEN